MTALSDKDKVTRFGVSMSEELVLQFDQYLIDQGYPNRSEALRDLVRKALLEPARLHAEQTVAGTIVMVYDHHASDLSTVLTELQHAYLNDIISTMHIHLSHKQCLEIIVVRGLMSRLQELHRQIQTQKGVVYAELSVTYADDKGDELAESHHEHHHG